MNHYYHEVPGRLRVKSPLLKGNRARCKTVEEKLGREPGVLQVSANPTTGSIIVNFDPRLVASQRVRELLTGDGHFHPERILTSQCHLSNAAEKLGQAVGKAVLGAMVERALAGSSLSILTALL